MYKDTFVKSSSELCDFARNAKAPGNKILKRMR